MYDKVFVYGTLKQGQSNFAIIGNLVISAKQGSISGALYDLGEYPAVIDGTRRIAGELLIFADPEKAFSLMDRLENYYGPNDLRNEYERKVVTVRLADGSEQDAYCYFYVNESFLRSDCSYLPNGCWPIAQ